MRRDEAAEELRSEGLCRLCARSGDIRDSHLIPKFVLRRFYRTSPTGGARTTGEPNLRREGTFLQKPLLCGECEQRFSRRERRWAQIDGKIEGPLPSSFACSDDHRYFAASLIWRILAWWDVKEVSFPFRDFEITSMSGAESALRPFLLDGDHVDGLPDLHMVTAPHGFTGAPRGLNVYLRASLDATTNAFGESLYCFAVLAGYLIVAPLIVRSESGIAWASATKMIPGQEVRVDPLAFPKDPDFAGILAARAAAYRQVPLSQKQQVDVKDRVDMVESSDLRLNPHVIAYLSDYLNEREAKRD